ncbi:MAG: hypothetical protein ISQ46_05640 [Methylophilaceae bacterium]|nr:hypothetical protein [Methylophilaceae bacterium]
MMFKFIITLFVVLIQSSSSFAVNLKPIEEILLSRNQNDPVTEHYLLQRCGGLYASLGIAMKDQNESEAAKTSETAMLFVMAAFEIDKKIKNNYSDDQANKLITENVEQASIFRDEYIEQMKINWTENAALFQGSFMEDDLNYCKKLLGIN